MVRKLFLNFCVVTVSSIGKNYSFVNFNQSSLFAVTALNDSVWDG